MFDTGNRRWQSRQGQSFLLLTFLVGAIMVGLGVLFVTFALSLSSSAYALRASTTAESLAFAGTEDAMVQLARNGAASSTYGLTFAAGIVNVTISQSVPSAGFVTTLSVATVGSVIRKLQAIFSENTTTYQVNLVSLQSVP